MRRQLAVGPGGLPGELLAWRFGLVPAHLPMVARPGFCRDGSRTVTSYLCTVAPEPPIWSTRRSGLTEPGAVPDPDVLYRADAGGDGVPDRTPLRESSPGGVYETLLRGHGLASARFPLRVPSANWLVSQLPSARGRRFA